MQLFFDPQDLIDGFHIIRRYAREERLEMLLQRRSNTLFIVFSAGSSACKSADAWRHDHYGRYMPTLCEKCGAASARKKERKRSRNPQHSAAQQTWPEEIFHTTLLCGESDFGMWQDAPRLC